MKLILASQSPRRRELLMLMGLQFDIVVSDVKEIVPENATPEETVMSLAAQKAEAVFREHPDCCVIGSDTVVYHDGHILGKPHTEEAAREYLHALNGKTHKVFTGVAVLSKNYRNIRYDETEVTFCHMTDEEIDAYVRSGDPLDKAGAYGIQGPFCVHVKSIKGSYFNVIGLPVHLVYEMLLPLKEQDQ